MPHFDWISIWGAGHNLFEADLQYADLRGVNLQGAVLDGANLRDALMDG